MDYVTMFVELKGYGNDIIKMMLETITKINNEKNIKDSFGNTHEVSVIEKLENAIIFQFLDLKCCIEFEICASRKEGFIKWCRIHEDFESKPQKTLIIKDSFDECGSIKTSLESKMQYDVAKAGVYFFQTLINFCEINDKIKFEQG